MPFACVRVRQVKPEEVPGRVAALQSDLKAATKEVEALRAQLSVAKAQASKRSHLPPPPPSPSLSSARRAPTRTCPAPACSSQSPEVRVTCVACA